ncbi:hypothetical protein DER44DRAFT_655099, partial [Fusarium oxysporum]
KDLIDAIPKLKQHTFRATIDNDFISANFLSSLYSGAYTTKLSENGVGILMGDVPDEKELYKLVNSPDSLSSLHMQLENYYPRPVCDALFPLYDVPKPGSKDDKPGTHAELYAPIVADAQVPASHRGFAHLLLNPPKVDGTKAMPPGRVHRYRIPWRAKGLDAWLRKEVGVCYSADMQNWMASGWRQDFSESDKEKAKTFLEPFGKLLHGEEVNWGNVEDEDRILWLDQEGNIHWNFEDPLWKRGMGDVECYDDCSETTLGS